MAEPFIITNGKFSISIETKNKVKSANFSRGVELAPGKPDDAAVWKDTRGNTVYKNPRTGHWRYYDTQKDTSRRMSSAYNLLKEQESREKEIKQIHKASELYIVDSLMGRKSKFVNQLDEKWKNSSDNSVKVIQKYLSRTGEVVKNVEYVGNKSQPDEFYTADIIIQTDKRNLGVSLKKTGNARMHNSSINQEEKSKEFFRKQDKLLSLFAPEGTRLNREIRKEIFLNNRNKKLNNGKTLEKTLNELRREVSKSLTKDIDNVTKSNNLLGKLNKIFNAIDNDTMIIVGDNLFVDSKGLQKLRNENKDKNPSFVLAHNKDGSNIIQYYGVGVARVGIRQDGKGYGTSMKLEATFTQEFTKKMAKTTHD